jgi:uncharacterized protein YyaL (SSP411 family)
MANRLANETSPYLLQHADNPVDLDPWSEEAFDAAREQDKPVLLSVGYSACHWCHVMAHESFENRDIARLMNEKFINNKVDREERPDVDSIYKLAVQMLTGQGGWPMTVFLTPDGRPFYGGTYFPPEDRRLGNQVMPGFPRLLDAVANAYHSRRDEIDQSADDVTRHLEQHYQGRLRGAELTVGMLDEALRRHGAQFDPDHGGFGGAPKFPPAMSIEFLLRSWKRIGSGRALEMAAQSLDQMARGGLYDQIGGGFHRYTVDAIWLVPHFEKMLYDNALLARVYALAWQATKEPLYRRVAEETLDYVVREMTDPKGGFYSTQDADSEGEEGKFYVWRPEEIEAVLGADRARIVNRYFDVTARGNFEASNVLSVPRDPTTVAEEFGIEMTELERVIDEARAELYRARATRVWPGRDEKVLTAWNGLMLRAMAEGAVILDREDLLEVAVRNARFLKDELHQDGRLLRVWKSGRARFDGYLEDYANLVDALISLYQATFDPAWISWATELAWTMIGDFWDEEASGFFDTAANHEGLITRPKDVFDSAAPSGNSTAAEALQRLALLTGDDDLRQPALAILEQYGEAAASQPTGFGRMLCAYDLALASTREIAIVGDPGADGTRALLDVVRSRYLPWAVVALAKPGDEQAAEVIPLLAERGEVGGKPAAYVCQNYACELPVTDPDGFRAQLDAAEPI